MTNFSKKSATEFPQHFKRAFNIYVGCGKEFSRQTIADLLGLSTLKTIENWASYNNSSVPEAYNILRLQAILPPGFKSMIEDFFSNDESKNLNIYRLNTDLCKFLGGYSGIIEDGDIDEKECRMLKIEIPEIIQKLDELLASINNKKRGSKS